MSTAKQIIFASMIVCALLATAAGQDSNTAQRSSLTIIAAATADRVRITAPSSIVQLRVEVYATSGEKLFDQEIRGGNVFDWHLQDGQAQRLAPGDYVCVVTAKSISGKLTQRIGTVSVAEKSVIVQPAESQQLSAAQTQTIGPVEENSSWMVAGEPEPQTPTVIAHDGTDGQMIRGRGALTFRIGNFFSGIDTEQMRLTEAGNLGIGTSTPMSKLDVAGTIRAERFLVAKPKPAGFDKTDALAAADAADSVQPLASGSGTQDRVAKWTDNAGTLGDSVITELAGNIGIGTPTPTQALDVANGRIVTTGSKTLAGTFDSMLEVKSTITNNGLAQSAIKARNIFNGSGDFVTGLDAAPTFAPSASINTAQGFAAAAFFAPPPGVTITNALGGASATVYSNTTGAVTNGTAFNVVSPFVFGALKPTNQFGLRINNQGIAGTTNSYGLFVDAQSGSTNNYSAIFAGGNVGIGTPAPSQRLAVNGTTLLGAPGGVYGFSIDAPSPCPCPSLGFNTFWNGSSYLAGATGYGGILQFFDEDGTLNYYTANSTAAGASHNFFPRLTIDSFGRVGIGTTIPTLATLVAQGGGASFNAVAGITSSGIGVFGASHTNDGVSGSSASGYAGFFDGKVRVTGLLEKPGGGFKIDHPLDPENKYLMHSFVESPDMKNLYDGAVTTDANGEATITLPDWFAALNRDFRYQLTCIGVFAQAIVAEKIKDNRFKIKTSLPKVEVSWQVTGVRQDAWANQNRLPVEELKPVVERGSYQNPTAFGQPEERSIEWARNPDRMKQQKEQFERWQREQNNQAAASVTRPNNR